jgi:translocation protein SEC62
MTTIEQQAKAPPEIRNVVSFLRSGSAGMKVRVGALNGKRIDYFKGSYQPTQNFLAEIHTLRKGKSAIKALLSPAYAKLKSVPKVTTEDEAQTLLHSIVPYAFFLRVERGGPSGSSSSSPKHLSIIQSQMFTPTDYYAWFYEGSQWTTYAGGLLMVAIILGGVMFPLWPPIMRLGVWYLSIGMLGLIALFFVIAIVRLIFYIITVIVASPGIWIFPKLFADVGFVSTTGLFSLHCEFIFPTG